MSAVLMEPCSQKFYLYCLVKDTVGYNIVVMCLPVVEHIIEFLDVNVCFPSK